MLCKFLFCFLSFLFLITGLSGKEFTYSEALNFAFKDNLSMPHPEKNGRVQTLNHTGGMFPQMDPATQAFLNEIEGKRVLEIGAAYGNILIKGLEKKVSEYNACDLDPRHLYIAGLRINELLNAGTLEAFPDTQIKFYSGDYPNDIYFPDNYFDSILVARVLHFFSPEKIDNAVREIHRTLKKGGKVYIVAITPYVKRYARFIPEYHRRRKRGDLYPGYVSSLLPYINKVKAKEIKRMHKGEFMFLDSKVLTRIFKKHNFEIIRAEEVSLGKNPQHTKLGGRDSVILIARKL